MGAMYRQLAGRGLAVVMGTLNDTPRIPEFIRQFGVPFSIGAADVAKAKEFMQISVMQQSTYYPWFALVDRKGMVRTQHFGDDLLFTNREEERMRELLEKYLAEGVAGKVPAGRKR
jgi:hypothetical protein